MPISPHDIELHRIYLFLFFQEKIYTESDVKNKNEELENLIASELVSRIPVEYGYNMVQYNMIIHTVLQ